MTKKVVCTKHAQDMLVFRRIKKSFVNQCLKKPDKILVAKMGRKVYMKTFGKKSLRVIGAENDEIIVITCYWIASGRVK